MFAGINFHPILVHFPVALFISAMGMEVLSRITKRECFHRTAFHLYILAAVAAIPAAITGWNEAIADHLHHPVVDLHRNLALGTLGIAWLGLLILWLCRKDEKTFHRLFTVFTLLVAFLVAAAGYNGGRLVYEYGVGVDQSSH